MGAESTACTMRPLSAVLTGGLALETSTVSYEVVETALRPNCALEHYQGGLTLSISEGQHAALNICPHEAATHDTVTACRACYVQRSDSETCLACLSTLFPYRKIRSNAKPSRRKNPKWTSGTDADLGVALCAKATE
jgi:hypothetical protein